MQAQIQYFQLPGSSPTILSSPTFLLPGAPKKPYQEPRPFTPAEAAQLYAQKIPFGVPIEEPAAACACRRPVYLSQVTEFKNREARGEDPDLILSDLGIERPCCRLEILKLPQVTRGDYLLPEERAPGPPATITGAQIVVETRQRPFHPVTRRKERFQAR